MKPDFPPDSRRKRRFRRRDVVSANAHGRASAGARGRVAGGSPGRVRIIAGEWGGRWLDVVDSPGLRPTGDRVRETLFNWLQMDVPGARCLDLFAGSGALGLEAASRGAAQVTLVDREPLVSAKLRLQLSALQGRAAAAVTVANDEDRSFLAECEADFDIVFLDPPFAAWLAGEAWQETLLAAVDCVLADVALVYLETPAASDGVGRVPPDWTVRRQRVYGEVRATLYSVQRPG